MLGQHGGHVRGDQFVLGHNVGLHPDTHTVIATHNHQLADSGDTKDLWFQVDADVITEEVLVIRTVRDIEREDL